MVLDYYNLREQPFGVTPDPRYLYASDTHIEALASLLYGIEAGRGFVALIAKPGMGKTTLLVHVLKRLQDKARVVFLFQTICSPADFLRAMLADLGIQDARGSLIELQSKLNEVVMEQARSGKPLIVVVDEAQNLDDSVLEVVRMLSNFETAQEKLIQMVLSGQPQLADTLASPELVQLRQRVSIFARLQPLTPEETSLYVEYRLRTAGYVTDTPLFTPAALGLIADCGEGIPRNINNLCFNALSLGCALKRTTIDADIVREVVADLDLEPLQVRSSFAAGSPTEMDGAQGAPAFASVASTPSMLTGWIPKFIGACAILLILGGALFQSHRWEIPTAGVQANVSVPPPASAPPSPASLDQASMRTAPPGIIRVTPGQSLYRICVENFGTCSPGRLQEIRALNPWLSNVDHIESGQRIRVPIVQEHSGVTQGIVKHPGDALPAERGRQ